jgi:hypothetical protein
VPGNEAAKHQGVEFSPIIFPDIAYSPIPISYDASVVAQIAPDLLILQGIIQVGFHGFFLLGTLTVWLNRPSQAAVF